MVLAPPCNRPVSSEVHLVNFRMRFAALKKKRLKSAHVAYFIEHCYASRAKQKTEAKQRE